MRIERLNKCCGSRGNLSAVDFQPHSHTTNTQRIATSGGTYVQIWSISKPEDKGSSDPVKCVLVFTYKDHSPYDVTTIRWSPNGQYLASTDSGGITNVLKRNERKTKVMESMVKSKLSGEPPEIPESYTETTQIKKYTIKYDGTDQDKKTNSGVKRISLNSKNVQIESKEVKADNLNLLNHDNLEGNLESWETLTSISCPNNMGQLFDISWAPDNRSIIGGGMNGHVIVFDIYTKEIVAKFDALENSQDSSSGRGYIKSVSWDPMTLFVAVQSSNKEISIWRRSPPLPPGSPMKWTFKRVMYTDHFSEKSNTDVLGGSRLSWAPNGKNVVFPNSCFNNHNFSTCYQIQHNTSSFSHIFNKSNYDKNQVQYHFDTIEHPIDLEPVLLKGHNSRIRNVRFSNDIMKCNQFDYPNHEKYLLLAQSSDDNMLSVWRFKLNLDCIISVECICVLKNLLDEQSSIEDLAWGDFGKCLAVASSQGGLILIHFNYEEMGVKFYTNRILGLNLNEMNQPSYEFFDYSEYVNSLAEDPNDSTKQNTDLNHTNGIKYKTITNLSQYNCYNMIKPNEKINLNLGKFSNIIVQKYFNENIKNLVDKFFEIKDFKIAFLIICYRIYLISVFFKINSDFNLIRNEKRLLNVGNVYNITFYNSFYLFNFTIESDSKNNQPKKKQKISKKLKSTTVLSDFITDIWLDMDYGSGNTIATRYWNDTDYVLENSQKEPEVSDNILNISNPDSIVDTTNINTNTTTTTTTTTTNNNNKLDKPTKVTRVSRSDKSKLNKLVSSNMLEFYNVNGLNDLNEDLFSYPVLKQSLSVSNSCKKFLSINFLNNIESKTFTSSLTSIDEFEFKVFWVRYLKKGYVTHMDTWSDYLVAISQNFESGSKSYLTVLNINNGEVYIDEIELGFNPICMFNLLVWNSPYFVLLTTNSLFFLYKYEHPKTLTQLLKLDLKISCKDNILKMEVVNSSLNYKSIFEQKFREYKDDFNFYQNNNDNKNNNTNTISNKDNNGDNENNNKDKLSLLLNDSIENLVLILYKKNKTVSIYSTSYKELELNLDSFNYSNNSLYSEKNISFNIDSLFRVYSNDPNSYMFGHVEFDGSLSKVIQSFSEDFDQNNNNNTISNKDNNGDNENNNDNNIDNDNQVDKLKIKKNLKLKLKTFLLLGSVWEYMLYLYEYVKTLFQIPDLQELIDFTSGMYKTIIRLINEDENNKYLVKSDEIKVYDFGNYYKLVPHCLLLLRSVVLPTLNSLYRRFQVDLNISLEHFDEYDSIKNKCKCLVSFENTFLTRFSPSLQYQNEEKNLFLEVC